MPVFVRPDAFVNCAIATCASVWRTLFVYVPVMTPDASTETLASVPAALPSAVPLTVLEPEYCVNVSKLIVETLTPVDEPVPVPVDVHGPAPFVSFSDGELEPLKSFPSVVNFSCAEVICTVVVEPSSSVIVVELCVMSGRTETVHVLPAVLLVAVFVK